MQYNGKMLDLRSFYQATHPSQALVPDDPRDRQYYIDFAPVRGGRAIEKIQNKIAYFSPDDPTCTLFTGYIGSGKSTELLQLKKALEGDGFQVVYFESSDDLELADLDIPDVLLAISRRICDTLDRVEIDKPRGFMVLLQGAAKILQTEFDLTQVELGIPEKVGIPGGLKFTADDGGKVSLGFGIGQITAKAKSDPSVREKLNQYLAPRTIKLLEMVNKEILEPAIAKLKEQGKKGLVTIVDNLDRIESRSKIPGRPQPEYIFVDRGEYLAKLRCHTIYTMPLSLKFSNDYGILTQRFDDPKVLPMIPVYRADGSDRQDSMKLLRNMVLARAFPELSPDLEETACDRAIAEIFDSRETLDRLCRISGGHVRDLLRLLHTWIEEEMSLPLTRETLEGVIGNFRNEMILPISDTEWKLLRKVRRTKKVSDGEGYQQLIRSRFAFEYREDGKSWFDVNPILAEAEELQQEEDI